MIKRLFVSTVLSVLLALPLAGCVEHKSHTAASATLNIGFEPIIAHDLQEMSGQAEVVVLGRFQKGFTKYNGSRDPHNPKMPSSKVYSEARSYRFTVDKALKGKVPSSIRVNLLYNQQIDGLISPEGKPVKVTVPSPSFFEPDPSKTYLLFLKKSRDVAGYTTAFQPYAIAFDAAGKAELIKPRPEISLGAGDQNAQARQIKVHAFTEAYADSVTGRPMDQILRQVESYVK